MSQVQLARRRERRSRVLADPPVLRRRSPLVIRLFKTYIRSYLRRHFNAVRLSRGGRLTAIPSGPLVVVLNHPSWWDPLFGILLTDLLPDRAHFAPIEAEALTRYRFFERLGFFAIRPASAGGARTFLDVGDALLTRPGTALWVTAQGRFTDPRQRPPGMQLGVGHLIRRLGAVTVLPLALEYPFWEERHPEALAYFGTPVRIEDGRAQSARAWVSVIERRLIAAQNSLAAEACRRDRADFDIMLRGQAGVGGVYDAWRRLRAWLRGEVFRPEHGQPEAPAVEDNRCC